MSISHSASLRRAQATEDASVEFMYGALTESGLQRKKDLIKQCCERHGYIFGTDTYKGKIGPYTNCRMLVIGYPEQEIRSNMVALGSGISCKASADS